VARARDRTALARDWREISETPPRCGLDMRPRQSGTSRQLSRESGRRTRRCRTPFKPAMMARTPPKTREHRRSHGYTPDRRSGVDAVYPLIVIDLPSGTPQHCPLFASSSRPAPVERCALGWWAARSKRAARSRARPRVIHEIGSCNVFSTHDANCGKTRLDPSRHPQESARILADAAVSPVGLVVLADRYAVGLANRSPLIAASKSTRW
jgi:hypothetical protein